MDDDQVVELALHIAMERGLRIAEPITSPDDGIKTLRRLLAGTKNEAFYVQWLDTQHKTVSLERIAEGTIDSATVHPRLVVESALRHRAARCILVHNHPSGTPEPSDQDIRLTDKIKNALATIEVEVLDHIIVYDREDKAGYTSFAERGLL